MNLLAIETATDRASIALRMDGKLYEAEHSGFREHAKVLLSLIDGLFLQSGKTLKAVDAIAFGCGPGSFTGLRVAASVVKALAFSVDCPVYPVNSLLLVASAITEENLGDWDVLSMLDARMNEVYWAQFNRTSLIQPLVVSPVEAICLKGENPVILAGVGFESFVEKLPKAVQSRIIEQHVVYPTASAMIRLIDQGAVSAVTAALAEPLYIRNQVTQGENRG